VGAGEIAAEPRDLCEIDGERLDPWQIGAITHSSVEHVDLGCRQRGLGWLLGAVAEVVELDSGVISGLFNEP
jgi:hypothetical protein